jgi:hypothetical protein
MGVSFLRSRVQIRARGNTNERAVCYLLHDPFDGKYAPTALRAAAEAFVNLAHPLSLSGLCKGGTNLLITKHAASLRNDVMGHKGTHALQQSR